jgi:hypothetical protein
VESDEISAPLAVRLIGYWREHSPEGGYPGMPPDRAGDYERLRQQGLRWPDARTLVDERWDPRERMLVVHHLEVGTQVNPYRGISRCRFCAADNGSAELADGAYCWPEGLAHYLREHGVRLPATFVDHVVRRSADTANLPSPSFNHLGQRTRDWPGADLSELLWQPTRIDYGSGYVDADPAWWLAQTAR